MSFCSHIACPVQGLMNRGGADSCPRVFFQIPAGLMFPESRAQLKCVQKWLNISFCSLILWELGCFSINVLQKLLCAPSNHNQTQRMLQSDCPCCHSSLCSTAAFLPDISVFRNLTLKNKPSSALDFLCSCCLPRNWNISFKSWCFRQNADLKCNIMMYLLINHVSKTSLFVLGKPSCFKNKSVFSQLTMPYICPMSLFFPFYLLLSLTGWGWWDPQITSGAGWGIVFHFLFCHGASTSLS